MMAHDTGAGLRARVTSPFRGVADGDVYPKSWPVGAVIEGDLARAALEGGYAERMPEDKAFKAGAPENKAGNRDGRRGGGRPSSSRRPARAKTQET